MKINLDLEKWSRVIMDLEDKKWYNRRENVYIVSHFYRG